MHSVILKERQAIFSAAQKDFGCLALLSGSICQKDMSFGKTLILIGITNYRESKTDERSNYLQD